VVTKKGDAVGGEFEQQVPQLAARDGVNARGRLVEENQFWFVQHGAAESEALLPSAGKLRGEAVHVRAEAVELDDIIHALAETVAREAVNAAVKREIFGDGQVRVQTEILRHVADVFPDGFRIFANVNAQHRGVAS
jgi:hypothetical protein